MAETNTTADSVASPAQRDGKMTTLVDSDTECEKTPPPTSLHPLCYITHRYHGSSCSWVVFGAPGANLPGFHIAAITEPPTR